MLKKIKPTETQSWKNLIVHFKEMKSLHMKDLFASDPERFNKYTIRFNDILVDYSKNIITEETLRLLLNLIEEVGLKDAIDKMFSGRKRELSYILPYGIGRASPFTLMVKM